MKRYLVLSAAVAAVLLAGCDPFGVDQTKTYITGRIWADQGHTTPAEGISVIAWGDSVNTYNRSDVTDAAGVFFIEMPLYPVPGEEEGSGYVLPGFATVGLEAYYQSFPYVYADIEQNPFYIQVGDTLVVWDIDLETAFGGK
jgi:hypothetical protein